MLFRGSWSFVSVRLSLLRPRRMIRLAPAVTKAEAVSRPMPVPFERSGVSNLEFAVLGDLAVIR